MNPDLRKQATFVGEQLLKAKALDPARSPRIPDDDQQFLEFCALWAQELHLERFPRRLWEQALSRWLHQPSAPRLSVGVWEQAAYQVRIQWEGAPHLRKYLDEARRRHLQKRAGRGELLQSQVVPLPHFLGDEKK